MEFGFSRCGSEGEGEYTTMRKVGKGFGKGFWRRGEWDGDGGYGF